MWQVTPADHAADRAADQTDGAKLGMLAVGTVECTKDEEAEQASEQGFGEAAIRELLHGVLKDRLRRAETAAESNATEAKRQAREEVKRRMLAEGEAEHVTEQAALQMEIDMRLATKALNDRTYEANKIAAYLVGKPPFVEGLSRICGSPAFNNGVLMAVLVNTALLSCDHHGIEEDVSLTAFLEAANYIFTVIFTVEMGIRIVGRGRSTHHHSIASHHINRNARSTREQ